VTSPLQSRRLGAAGAGKVIPNRLFYFAGFEWFDDETSRVVNSAFPERNGSVPATADHKLYIAEFEGQASAANLFRIRLNGDRRRSTGEGVGGRVTEDFGRSSTFNELRAAFVTTAHVPIVDDRSHRDPERFCRLLDREATKEAQLNGLTCPFVEGCKMIKCLLERDDVDATVRRGNVDVIDRDRSASASRA